MVAPAKPAFGQHRSEHRVFSTRGGFTGIEAEDLSAEWVAILHERVRRYAAMREDTVTRFVPARDSE
jgi:hypothetical protein